MTNTVAIIQARIGGTRLPGKVLASILGRPMLQCQMERLERCRTLDSIVIAIPDTSANDMLAELCFTWNYALYRGSETDVLGRYLGAAEAADADTVVRVTADCPLIDPGVIDDCVRLFQRGGATGPFDFVANNLQPTFPHGLDCEVMSRGTLAIAEAKATTAYDREHVTPWITRADAGGAFLRLGNLACPTGNLSRYRLTVDYPEDLAVIRAIYERFGPGYFTTQEVVAFLGVRPDLIAMNSSRRLPTIWNVVGTA